MVTVTTDTKTMYKNYTDSMGEMLFDGFTFDSLRLTEHMTAFSATVKGIVTGDLNSITTAFKDGLTAALLYPEKMSKLQTALDSEGKRQDDIQILIYHNDKLILSLVNDQIVW